ncbi:hypothetical protein BH09BAC1_BH09BAC1_21930 [soil metagenome]
MTVKDIKQQIAPYSTQELHLWELAIHQELEERGMLPVFQDDPKVLTNIKALDEGIDAGTVKTHTLDEFKQQMAKRRAS